MTQIVHEFDSEKTEAHGKDDPRFLLTNKNGSYLCVPSGNTSRYDGYFWHDGTRMLRIIDEIKTLQAPEPKSIINRFSEVERTYSQFSEKYFVPANTSGFHYQLSQRHSMVFDFDIRESYDVRVWGRNFEVKEQDGAILVAYTKTKDAREDGTSKGDEYTLYTAIKTDGELEKIGQWVQKTYETDFARHSEPHQRHVYRAFDIKGTRAAVGVGWSAQSAIDTANEIFQNYQNLLAKQITNDRLMLGWHLDDPNIGMAYRCAIHSLNSLCVERGVFAGLPWFFQIWGRDQSISLKALILQKRYSFAKKIILDSIQHKDTTGRISNIITGTPSTLGSADATGWLIIRISDFFSSIENDGQLKLYLSKQDVNDIVTKIEAVIDELTRTRAKEGLVSNGALETWMDTKYDNDTRSGERIEIQALQIAAYSTLYKLTNKKFYSALAESCAKQVRKKFWNGSYLTDGVGDETIRPNVFIAYYCAPQILTPEEWKQCFDHAVSALWNQWGGLSTIDKKNPLYTEVSTGQDVKSYHRGDSWFWLNNLSALCMHRLDKLRYKLEIEKILRASTQEILYHGCIGHHSEISSSRELHAEGCFSQAWSAALYIELVDELFVK